MVGESGGSAERRAAELRAQGKTSAGAWAAGAEGERRVADALTQLPEEWLVLHDRLLMPGLAESNLDHLLVGPAGVILVDAKNWAGQIGEWEGSVFQHKWGANGERAHRPVDREFAVVAGMATEVARRINHRVIAVICLAGRAADQFGEPRLVKNVWVVPLSGLVEWLTARPQVEPEHLDRLGVLVRTEFPSTTTDAGLLVAIGRDLAQQSPVRSPVVAGRRARTHGPLPSPPSRSQPRRAPSGRPSQRRSRRRQGLMRPFLGLVAAIALLIAVKNGALTAVTAEAGSAVSQALASAIATADPAVATGAGGAGQEAATPTLPTLLSCRSLDPSDHKQLSRATLSPVDMLDGCYWTMPVKGGVAPVKVLWIREDTKKFGLLPTFPQSADRRAPVVTKGWRNGRWTTHVWIAKGVPLKVGKNTVEAQRHTEVMLAHEALGLTEKQGRALALSITAAVSSSA